MYSLNVTIVCSAVCIFNNHHADVRYGVIKNQIYTHGRFPLQQSTVDAQLQALIVESHARPLAHSP